MGEVFSQHTTGPQTARTIMQPHCRSTDSTYTWIVKLKAYGHLVWSCVVTDSHEEAHKSVLALVSGAACAGCSRAYTCGETSNTTDSLVLLGANCAPCGAAATPPLRRTDVHLRIAPTASADCSERAKSARARVPWEVISSRRHLRRRRLPPAALTPLALLATTPFCRPAVPVAIQAQASASISKSSAAPPNHVASSARGT